MNHIEALKYREQCKDAIPAINEALAAPVQEPDLAKAYREELDKLSQRNYELRMENAELKATPPAAQRKWVGLTNEEIDRLDCIKLMWQDYESCEIHGIKEFAEAIEAKLKEKNV